MLWGFWRTRHNTRKQRVFVDQRTSVRGTGRGGQTTHPFVAPPSMSVLSIPTGPPISENKCVRKRKSPCAKGPLMSWCVGSITYDREKGGMTHQWDNEQEFLAWHAAEESNKVIELIVSQVLRSDSLIWREWCVFKCSREFTGGKSMYERTTQSERKIPSKKTGCWCSLVIKKYPHTETILGRYIDEHDHMLGDENLRFTRLSDTTRAIVTDMVYMGVEPKTIVCTINFIFISGLTRQPLSSKNACENHATDLNAIITSRSATSSTSVGSWKTRTSVLMTMTRSRLDYGSRSSSRAVQR